LKFQQDFASKPPGGKKGALPLLVFRFHTAGEHLVGIDPRDFTTEAMA
jgi:hypothetical protein